MSKTSFYRYEKEDVEGEVGIVGYAHSGQALSSRHNLIGCVCLRIGIHMARSCHICTSGTYVESES